MSYDTMHAVYRMIPDVHCKGLCHLACGPIMFSHLEAMSMQENGIRLPHLVEHPVHGRNMCNHLGTDMRCGAYEHRPLVCRLFGAVEGLACPHGCKPDGPYVSDDDVIQMLTVLDDATGVHPHISE